MATDKPRKGKPVRPPAEQPIEWPRADPAALVNFDPRSKSCTMNCSKSGLDPRSREERLFLCDDCDTHAPTDYAHTTTVSTVWLTQLRAEFVALAEQRDRLLAELAAAKK